MSSQKRKLKILHVIEGLGSGGAERLLYTNLRQMDRESTDHLVLTVFEHRDYWKTPIEDLGISVRSLGVARKTDLPRAVMQMKAIIYSFAPDIVHTHLWTANIIGRFTGWLAGVPVISSIHNPEYESEAAAGVGAGIKLKIRAARILDALTAWLWCAKMIAVSRFVKESTGKWIGYPLERIEVLYNPVDDSMFADTGDEVTTLGELGFSKESVIILNVGRIAPQKGLVYAVRAMPTILGEFPSAKLVSVGAHGDGACMKELKDEIDDLGLRESVHLLGERRNVQDYIRASTVFLFPSLFEGLGIALAEAMATGRVIVASDIKPINEFVTHGVNGILVEPRNQSAIAEAVLLLLRNDKKRKILEDSGKKTALEYFEPRQAVEALMRVYRSVYEHGRTKKNLENKNEIYG